MGSTAGGLRARVARALAPQAQVHDEEEQRSSAQLGGTPCASLPTRCRCQVSGTLRSVTLRPRAGVPALEAELFDGSGSVSLVWLGRRRIAGVEPGRRIRAEGFVTDCDGRRVVFNPRYELVPRAGD